MAISTSIAPVRASQSRWKFSPRLYIPNCSASGTKARAGADCDALLFREIRHPNTRRRQRDPELLQQQLVVASVIGGDKRDRVARQQRLRQLFQKRADSAHDGLGNMKQQSAMPARIHDDVHQLIERHQIGTANFVSLIAAAPRHRQRHARREVIDQHWLNPLLTGAWDSKYRSEAQRARQSVDDLVLGTVHQRRAEDRVSQTRVANRALGTALGAKSRMSAVLVGGSAADIYELSN